MLYKAFSVTGVANETVLDDGLVSLVDEQYRLVAVIISCNEWEGNIIEGWIGTNNIISLYDYVIDTRALEATMPVSTMKMNKIEVNEDIPAGQIFKIGVNSGATATDIAGAYVYERIT